MTNNQIDVNIIPMSNGSKKVMCLTTIIQERIRIVSQVKQTMSGILLMKKCLGTSNQEGLKYSIARFAPCVDSMA